MGQVPNTTLAETYLGFGYFWGVMGSQLSEEPVTTCPEAPNNHQYTVIVLWTGWWLPPLKKYYYFIFSMKKFFSLNN